MLIRHVVSFLGYLPHTSALLPCSFLSSIGSHFVYSASYGRQQLLGIVKGGEGSDNSDWTPLIIVIKLH